MKVRKNHILKNIKHTLLILAVLSASIVFGQQKNILEGTVRSNTGNALPGVIVSIQESTTSAITDEAGKYSIAISAGDKLSFTYVGYESQTKAVSENQTRMDVILTEMRFGETESDFISIAYNNRSKRNLTAAVSTTTIDQISKQQDMNTMNNLSGLISGLIVMSTPWTDTGSDPSFYVRGLKTTNSNNAPLVLVDDVERNFGQFNVNEIESVSVLKDAAALAVYGNRGANGVILVRTKRGNKNKREVIINANVGMAESTRIPQFLNSYDYARLYNKAQELDGVATANLKYNETQLQGYKDVVEGAVGANPYKYPNVNFYADYLKPIVKQQQYDLTMRGGNNTAQYFVLLGYMNQEGLYKYGNNDFQRFNFRSNLDIKVFPKLDMRIDMAGRVENLTVPGGNYAYSIFSVFANTPSNAYPIFNENGTLGGTSVYKSNPYGMMNKMGQRDQTARYFDATLKFKLDLSDVTKGLSWNGRGGIDFVDSHVSQLTASKFAVWELLADGTYTNNATEDVAKTQNFWYEAKNRQFTLQTSFNYDRVFNDHRVSAMSLFYLRELNTYTASVPYKTVGFAGTASYGYLNRYLLDVSASYTGSENFASGHRFGFFPSVSAGWIVSDEAFLKNNKALSFLKLRASYGTAGLDRPISDRFLYRENWGSANGYSFGTAPNPLGGTDQLRLGNDNLKWETSYKSNIGLDFGFMNNTLLWTIDGFIDNRKDILVQKYATTPAAAGLALPYENAGETKSWGFDTELTYDKQLSKNFRLTVKANAMLTRSEIININETFKVDSYQYAAGNPISQPFGYVNLGFFTQDEITRRAEGYLTDAEKAQSYDVIQNGGNLRAGDIKYKDLNGDKKIDGRDTRPIGGSGVPNLIGALNLGFKYYQFYFSAQVMAMGQRWLYMPNAFRSNFNGGGNATLNALKAWTPETVETALYPRLSISNNSNNQQYSDFWFRDASFIRLKSLEIGYNIPSAVLKVVGINKTRLYANGYNLFTFDKMKDFDPENTEAAFSRYPYKRIITLGVSVTF